MQIQIDGKKINYEVEGEGYPVVLLHGWLANLDTMKPIANILKENFKVYNIDVIGFGKSEMPEKPYSSNDFGDFLKKILENLQIEKPILIGHSNGGRIIINACGRKIVSPKKIVLIDSAGIKPKRKLNYYIKIYSFKLIKQISKILPNTEIIKERIIKKYGSDDYKNSPEVLRRTMSIIVNEDQRELLKNINVPTLLIWGENDTATPIRGCKNNGKTIKRCGNCIIPKQWTLFILRKSKSSRYSAKRILKTGRKIK